MIQSKNLPSWFNRTVVVKVVKVFNIIKVLKVPKLFNVLLALMVPVTALTQTSPFATFTDRSYWKNVVDLSNRHEGFGKNLPGLFADLGAWQAYSFPDQESRKLFFEGPFLLDRHNINPFPEGLRLIIQVNQDDISEEKKLQQEIISFPGMLQTRFRAKDIEFVQSLIFIDQRTALFKLECHNTGKGRKAIKVELAGKFDRNEIYTQSAFSRGVKIYLKSKGGSIITRLMGKTDAKTHADSSFFSIRTERTEIPADESFAFYFTQTYCISQPDDVNFKGVKVVPDWDMQFRQNEKRWNQYLTRIFKNETVWLKQEPYARVAVKSLITLMTNWRSAAGDLLHDGILPSVYEYDGLWAWDSWKQAAACAIVDPALGKNSVRAMLDYQDEAGMIPDCIFTDKKLNNWRNTKPPMAAWAVWRLFEATRDTNFLWETVHHLFRYHNWWYRYRDHDKNGLCEFGSADGTLEAARWESGMDNAARFDSAAMVKNADNAWSLNQESVDLNAFLYYEKTFLEKISAITKAQAGIETGKNAAELKKRINEYFYDEFSGYYYDRKPETGEWIKTKGPEGWLPLWTETAGPREATGIVKEIKDPDVFNTFLPFPTLNHSDSRFNPDKGYWRGPVWIDQAAFAIEGLRKYGYNTLSDEMLKKLLDNAEGLTGTTPLYENYHPLTGKGLNTPFFSWSAAHWLMLLCE